MCGVLNLYNSSILFSPDFMDFFILGSSIYCHFNWNVVTVVWVLLREEGIVFSGDTVSSKQQPNYRLLLFWLIDHEDRKFQSRVSFKEV